MNLPPLTPTARKLIIFMVIAYVSVACLEVAGVHLVPLLSLNLTFDGPLSYLGLAWQPLTYWFVYPAVTDELLNVGMVLLMVYFFLSPFERVFGPRRTLILCLLGVLSGALSTVALAHLLPARGPYYGGGVVVAAAFGTFPVIFQDAKVLFMFVVPMKAWTALAVGVAAMAFVAILARDPFVFAADVTATLAGIGYAKWLLRTPKQDGVRRKRRRRGGPKLQVIEGGADDDRPRWLN